MVSEFERHINSKLPFLKGSKLLVAISGGIDSVVLTHLLNLLDFDISLAHCNFQLRGNESDLDENFIIDLAKKINAPCFTESFETTIFSEENKISIQMAARELRYNWFNSILNKHKLDYVLTAHQKDDILETFLINFTRGTGLDGLTGIPEINNQTIRPLLLFSRNEIENYAKKNNIEWREDASNSTTKYARNKIRHAVIPILKEINPSLLDSFDKTIQNLKGNRAIINESINKIKKDIIVSSGNLQKLDIEKIKNLSNPKAYLYQFLIEYNFTEWDDINNLINAQSGKQIFSKTHRLIKDRNYLLLSESAAKQEDITGVIDENKTKFSNYYLTLLIESVEYNIKSDHDNSMALIDKELLKYPLKVRKWEKGDYFYPIGMNGKKKLSKFFKDEKLSLIEKENTWLLCSSKNEIIWIIGRRLDNRFKITSNTNQSLKITYSSNEKIN